MYVRLLILICHWYYVAQSQAVTIPPVRVQFSLEHNGTHTFLFGGQYNNKQFFNDLWVIESDLSQNWTVFQTEDVSNQPKPRANAALCPNRTAMVLYVVGGIQSDETILTDVWSFNFSSNNWAMVTQALPDVEDVQCVVVGDSIVISGHMVSHETILVVDVNTKLFVNYPAPSHLTNMRVTMTSLPNLMYLLAHESGEVYTISLDFVALRKPPVFQRQSYACSLQVNYATTLVLTSDGTPFCLALYRSNVFFQQLNGINSPITSQKLPWSFLEFHDIGHITRDDVNNLIFIGGQLYFTDELFSTTLVIFTLNPLMSPPGFALYQDYIPVPLGRVFHSAGPIVVASQMVLFGGSSPSIIGDTWMYDTKKNAWTEVLTDGSPSSPNRRAHHVMIVRGEAVLLHGGIGADNSYLSDLWAYSVRGTAWTFIQPDTAAPRERAGHIGFRWNSHIAIHGGTNVDATAMNDMYVFRFRDRRWFKVSGTHPPLRYHSCTEIDTGILVAGGEKVSGLTTTAIYVVKFTTNGDSYSAVWTRVISLGISRTEHILFPLVPQRSFLVYGGLSRLHAMIKSTFQINISPNSAQASGYDVNSTFRSDILATSGYGQSFAIDPFNGRALIFGGKNEFGYSNDVVSIGIQQQTFQCPAGSYGKVAPCQACPAGFSLPYDGAQSELECLPCPNGTYAPTPGSLVCTPCPSSYNCSIGTVALSNEQGFQLNKLSDYSLPSGAAESANVTNIAVVAGIVFILSVALILAVVVALMEADSVDEMFKNLDLLFAESHHIVNGPMIKRSTMCGGVGTVLLATVLVPLYIMSVIPYQYDNIQYSSSLRSGEGQESSVSFETSFKF
eukprot:PhF_6_TR31809/c0_g2_i1/m.46942